MCFANQIKIQPEIEKSLQTSCFSVKLYNTIHERQKDLV